MELYFLFTCILRKSVKVNVTDTFGICRFVASCFSIPEAQEHILFLPLCVFKSPCHPQCCNGYTSDCILAHILFVSLGLVSRLGSARTESMHIFTVFTGKQCMKGPIFPPSSSTEFSNLK